MVSCSLGQFLVPLLATALLKKDGVILSWENCRFSALTAKRKITALSCPWSGSKRVLSHYLNTELWYYGSWYPVALGSAFVLAGVGQKAVPLQQTVLVPLLPGAWAPTLDDVVLAFFLFCLPSASDSNTHILSMGHPEWRIRISLTWIVPQVPSHCWGLALSCSLLSKLKVASNTREGISAMFTTYPFILT